MVKRVPDTVENPWETRTLVKVYTPLTHVGTVFKMNGKPVPDVWKAEVFSDGFARLYTYSKPGADIAAMYELDPYMCGVITHVLEGFVTVEPVEAYQLEWELLSGLDTVYTHLCAEQLEIPAKNGWRRFVSGRVFVVDLVSMDVGLVKPNCTLENFQVHWLPPHSREYADGLRASSSIRTQSWMGRRWNARCARNEAEDLKGLGIVPVKDAGR